MVEFLKTYHRNVEVNYQNIGEEYSEVIWHCETPLIRTAPAPLFALSRLVYDNHIKVVLTGEGADEFFGGYNIFKENRIRRFCKISLFQIPACTSLSYIPLYWCG